MKGCYRLNIGFTSHQLDVSCASINPSLDPNHMNKARLACRYTWRPRLSQGSTLHMSAGNSSGNKLSSWRAVPSGARTQQVTPWRCLRTIVSSCLNIDLTVKMSLTNQKLIKSFWKMVTTLVVKRTLPSASSTL